MCSWVPCACSVCGSQKRALDPLELELAVVRVLGIELEFSGRTFNVLSHQVHLSSAVKSEHDITQKPIPDPSNRSQGTDKPKLPQNYLTSTPVR